MKAARCPPECAADGVQCQIFLFFGFILFFWGGFVCASLVWQDVVLHEAAGGVVIRRGLLAVAAVLLLLVLFFIGIITSFSIYDYYSYDY